MIGSVMRKLSLFTAGISAVFVFSTVKPAHAERVISDYEASKLTLESLTAAPVYHVVHHISGASHSRAHSFQVAAHRNSQGLIHLASFRTVKRSGSAMHVRHRT